jgi:hypothetical protein
MMDDSAFLTTLFFLKSQKVQKSRQVHKFFVNRLMGGRDKRIKEKTQWDREIASEKALHW